MFAKTMIRFALPGVAALLLIASTNAQAQSRDTPMTRMRPIGAPSAVDQYKPRDESTTRLHETAFQSPVRQTAMLQSGPTAPTLPVGPSTPLTLPANSSAQPVPTVAPVAGTDLQPVPQPQLGSSGFTTIDNSCLVSPPSSYNPAFVHDCNNTIAPQSYVAQPVAASVTVAPPPAEVVVPAVPAVPTATVPSSHVGAPARSLVTFGQERFPVNVGQGIVGQPVAYVPGQPLRNWLRYFTP